MREPIHSWSPPRTDTYGDLAAGLAEQVGMPMDDEQRLVLDAIFAEDEPGTPTCFAVGVVAPRQNLKTATLEIAALTDVFILGEQLHVWTAHLFDTAQRAFTDMVAMIGRTDDLRERCKWPPSASHGDEAIELLTGERIEFHARSTGGGRGLSGNRITVDEALFWTPSMAGALLPILATRPSAQVRYGSSAGLLRSAVLRSIRDRGRNGQEARLAWFEWGAPAVECERDDCPHTFGVDGCALDREELWLAANPALGRRISMTTMRDFRRELPPAEFSREFLSWWEDPPEGGGELALDPQKMADAMDRTSEPAGQVVLAVDVAPDRTTSLTAAGWRTDGRKHGEVIRTAKGTGWVVDVVLQVVEAHDPKAVVLDERVTGLLGAQLRAAGIEPMTASGQQVAQASTGLADDVLEDRFRWRGDAPLAAAAGSAVWRTLGDGKAFDRKGGAGISPLVSVALADWALETLGRPDTTPPPPPESIPPGGTANADTFDLANAGF